MPDWECVHGLPDNDYDEDDVSYWAQYGDAVASFGVPATGASRRKEHTKKSTTNPQFNFVGVRFRKNTGELSSTEYTFKTKDATLKPGDAVVVQSNEKFLYGIGFVTSLSPEVIVKFANKYQWVVQKVVDE